MHIYTERVNKGYLGYILNHFEELGVPMGVYENGKKTTDLKSVHTLLVKYYQSLNDEGEVSIEYRQKNGYGRKWTMRTGLTNLSKVIRHTIGAEYHIDIDMENAHPVLLLNWLEQQHFNNCPTLKDYIENRDEILKRYMDKGCDRDEIKTFFLSMTNGGELKMELKDDFTTKYYDEITGIYTFIRQREPLLYEKGLKKKPTNPYGAMINYLMCDLENRALDCIIHYFQEKGVKITSLAYDGLTIERTEDNERRLDEYLRGAEKNIRRLFPSNIKLTEKKMTRGLTTCVEEEYEFFEEEEENEPERLLQPVKKCLCRITSVTDLMMICNAIVSEYDIRNNHSLYKIPLGFLKGCVCEGCKTDRYEAFLEEMKYHREPTMKSIMDDIYKNCDSLTWSSVFQMLGNTKNNRPSRAILQSVLSKIETERTMQPTSSVSVNPQSFNEDDHYFHFREKCLTTIFSDKAEATDFFISNFDRYFKYIAGTPRCLVLNTSGQRKGGNKTTDKQVFDIKKITELEPLYTRYRYISQDTVRIGKLPLITSSPKALLWDLDIMAKLPSYYNLTFYPSLEHDCSSDYAFNMFSGFKAKEVEEVDMSLIEPFLYHIKMCWADGNEDSYDYILQWLHHALLTPWIKTQIVLLLYGNEGTGKGFLIDHLLIPLIYGRTNASTAGLEDITGRFNTICMNKLLLTVNEVQSKENWSVCFETLKKIITDPTLNIEKKGIDTISDYPNFINLLMTTNNEISVKMGRSDRRYGCFHTSDRFKGNTEYFEKLALFCNQENANHFFTYIRRLKKTRNLRNIPMTDLRREMLSQCDTSVDMFVRDITERQAVWRTSHERPTNEEMWDNYLRNRLQPLTKKESTDTVFATADNLYVAYKMYCKFNTYSVKSRKIFGVEIKRHIGSVKTRTGTFYRIL